MPRIDLTLVFLYSADCFPASHIAGEASKELLQEIGVIGSFNIVAISVIIRQGKLQPPAFYDFLNQSF